MEQIDFNRDERVPSGGHPRVPFAPTRWTLVLRASGATSESRSALSELCEAYYQPVLAFLRREGRDEDTARELAQEFFARLLARGGIGAADPQRGRFRSYLLGAVKHFLADRRDYERRAKRGGGSVPQPLDNDSADSPAFQVADAASAPNDAVFDRAWALALMNRSVEILAAEFSANDKREEFAMLKPWLVGDAPALPQAEAASRLGISESALKVAIHRLRKRFREIIRLEIAQTLETHVEIEAELRYLVEVLST